MRAADWLFGPLTVYLEAEGETFDGKLAVAYVIVNRARSRGLSVVDTVLAPHQFSCWDSLSSRRSVLDSLKADVLEECVKAYAAASWGFRHDPTNGSTHYLNVEAVLAAAGKLPTWARDPEIPTAPDPGKVRARIGKHTFLRLPEYA